MSSGNLGRNWNNGSFLFMGRVVGIRSEGTIPWDVSATDLDWSF